MRNRAGYLAPHRLVGLAVVLASFRVTEDRPIGDAAQHERGDLARKCTRLLGSHRLCADSHAPSNRTCHGKEPERRRTEHRGHVQVLDILRDGDRQGDRFLL